jgi:hypothetical protein
MADDTVTKVSVVASALAALGVMFAALADTPRLCAPGQQKACTCADATVSAAQACAPDGLSYGACGPCPAVTAPTAQPAPAATESGAAAAKEPSAAASASPVTCAAKLGALKVSNHKLTGATVLAEVGKAEAALNACCASASADAKPGTSLVRLVVGREGKVANVLNAGHGPAAALPACALDAFRGLDFAAACKPSGPKCNAGGVIDVPLAFDSK